MTEIIDRDRWQTLEPLLDRALELSPEERSGWLAELRESSPEVARELEALLSEDEAADRQGFLADIPNASLAGMRLGAYTIEAPLGHGGMGTVWLANRTDGRFEGRAAVKILNLSLLSPAGQERFRREGSTLARLTHPGIGRLLDAGVSPSGQPYLVLELVEGTPIDQYVESRRLGPTACVELFLQVLDAVAHAHANLVVHRDIKPSNILVANDGSAKLLDFGIAKLLSGSPESSAQTIGGQQAFTPRFAAPEQLQGGTITTGTDIYSLGVLLALLLGREPENADRRLGHGDLDTVVARATHAEPAKRYRTVAEFAEDLRHWMRHEPVSARPDSMLYRVRKFLRRHATATIVTLLFAALAVAYIVTVTRDRERVRQALADATAATRKAEQVTDFAVGLFESEDGAAPFPMGDAGRELLARGTARARELVGQPTLQAQMLDVIGRIYAQQGERDLAHEIFTEALDIRRKALGDDHPDVATSLINIGSLLEDLEPKEKAIPYLRRALEIRRKHFGDEDERTNDALYRLASTLHMIGDFDAARTLYDEWIRGALVGSASASTERANRLGSMAFIAAYSGQFRDAERLARQVVEVQRELFGDDHPQVALALTQLGTMLLQVGKPMPIDSLFTRPIDILRHAYPEGHPDLANALRDYALALGRFGRWEEAERTWKEAAEMYKKVGRERSLAYANALSHCALAMIRLGRPQEALGVLREAIERHADATPRETPVLARANLFMAMAHLDLGDPEQARALLRTLPDSILSPGDPTEYYMRLAEEARKRAGEW